MSKLRAFHGNQEIKDQYLNRVRAHTAADEIIKGQYWKNGKGCAVGCTIHSSNHNAYEQKLGIPEWLAWVEDTIFEGLPNERAQLWPEQFLSVIKPGVDLEKVKAPFLIFILESALQPFDHKKFPDVKISIDIVTELCRSGEKDLDKYETAAAGAAEAA